MRGIFMNYKYSLKKLLFENSENVAGTPLANKLAKEITSDEVHVFDFDDTLGVTMNSNGIMPIRGGKPIFHDQSPKGKQRFMDFLKNYYKLQQSDFLPSANGGDDPVGIRWSPVQKSWTAYVSSAGLAKARSHNKGKTDYWGSSSTEKYANAPQIDQSEVINSIDAGDTKPIDNEIGLAIDFEPSGWTDLETTKPIKSSIEKLDLADKSGATTAVMTARAGKDTLYGFDGTSTPVTNAKDMTDFLVGQGAEPDSAEGLRGGDKGERIQTRFIDNLETGKLPKEIHFYDDDEVNITNVRKALSDKPVDLFLYGHGEFNKGHADAWEPDEVYLNSPEHKMEESIMKRWHKLAGIK